jgi:transcriptional regulator with XRE-family HTH domain
MRLNRIKEVLESKGVSQKSLSDKLGVSVVTVNFWCNQKSQPSLRTLFDIASALEVSPDQLIQTDKKV